MPISRTIWPISRAIGPTPSRPILSAPLPILHERRHSAARSMNHHRRRRHFDLKYEGVSGTRPHAQRSAGLECARLGAHPDGDRFVVQRLAGHAKSLRTALGGGDSVCRADAQEVLNKCFEAREVAATPRSAEHHLGKATVDLRRLALVDPAPQALGPRIQTNASVTVRNPRNQRVRTRVLKPWPLRSPDPQFLVVAASELLELGA